jgi:hypothetical protein
MQDMIATPMKLFLTLKVLSSTIREKNNLIIILNYYFFILLTGLSVFERVSLALLSYFAFDPAFDPYN